VLVCRREIRSDRAAMQAEWSGLGAVLDMRLAGCRFWFAKEPLALLQWAQQSAWPAVRTYSRATLAMPPQGNKLRAMSSYRSDRCDPRMTYVTVKIGKIAKVKPLREAFVTMSA
jgi:hypothetical protein